ncbi:alpha/beta hydrolase [Acidisphaera sp. L21]|uniref:alpha/beta hydrolase n=1 Tax=Acidisphaera sp. L21 TaxID=1641851 RepID=UPI00131CE772|nr:alpha/beta hydrolase [Acidisphaera sp. L21]
MSATDSAVCVDHHQGGAARWTRRALVSLGGLMLLAGCQTYTPFLDANGRANEDMAAVIDTYVKLGAKPVHLLTVDQARTQPTLGDAVRAVKAAQTGRPFTADVFTQVRDLQVDGAAGPLQARLYDATPGRAGEPIILYFHGGGWVTGDLNTYDASDRALASQAHAKVLSVAYRLAPENKFPAAHDDAFASYRWLLANAASLGADPRRIAVAGESAGGNLAINVSIAARDAHIRPPVHELLIYPVAGADTMTPSYIANQAAVPLGREDILWYVKNTVNSPADLQDPRLDLIGKADLHNLPPTTIVSAEIDPLESDGTFLTYKLQAQGVTVDRIEYGGTTHEFFGMGAVVARAGDAEAFAAKALDATFDKIGNPPAPVVSRGAAVRRRAAARRAAVRRAHRH